MTELVVVTGGVRSGKSAVAEQLLAGFDGVTYIATAQPSDPEMAARIERHRARRRATWQTVEADDLVQALADASGPVLLDGLGLWLGLRLDRSDADLLSHLRTFAAAAGASAAPVVIVVEQVGGGLVPVDAATRRWVDLVGEATQTICADADRVLLAVGGRVTDLDRPAPLTAPVTGLRRHGDTMVPEGTLDLAVNVHGSEPPAHLVEAIATGDLARYPDDAPARQALAQRHRRSPDEILVTAGAADAFWLLATALRFRHAAVVHPQFTEPEAALRAAGVAVTTVMRRAADEWALDPGAIPDSADLVVLGRPNNPTGTLDPVDVVLAVCRPGRLTVVDEAFIDFVVDEPDVSLAPHADTPGLVVVRSVTKLWGLAGLRAGYIIAPPAIIDACCAARRPWAVATPALTALERCAGDERYRVEVAARVSQQRQRLVASLRAVSKVEVWDAAANFVLLRVPDGAAVHTALLARGIAVRPSTFPGLSQDFLRVAVRDAEATARLCGALTDLLA